MWMYMCVWLFDARMPACAALFALQYQSGLLLSLVFSCLPLSNQICTAASPVHIRSIAPCPCIQLDLSGCYCLRGPALRHLQPLRHLRYLNLAACSGLDCALTAPALAALPALREVDVADTPLERLRRRPAAGADGTAPARLAADADWGVVGACEVVRWRGG